MKSLLGKYQLHVADVGAAGGLDSRWKFLEPNLIEILFEPGLESFKELEMCSEEHSIIFNSALSDSKKEVNFNICRWHQASSIYEPNFNIIKNYPNPERFEVIDRITMEADSLSNLLSSKNVKSLDFLKIDTQGSELEILKGAGNYIDSVIGVEVEVEFVELYKNQPLFDEVHAFLLDHGLTLIDLKRSFWSRDNISDKKGQLIFADGLYFRRPESILETNLSEERVLKAISVYLAYGYSDFAYFISNEALHNRIISKDQMDLISAYMPSTRRLPNFRGKARIKMIFDFFSKKFTDNSFTFGTDDKLGN